jgi:phosphohistidine phosphatase SixA
LDGPEKGEAGTMITETRSKHLYLILCVGLLWLLLACPSLTAEDLAAGTTVVVVRHAEKATLPAEDPVLTEKGMKRAEIFASMLDSARVSAIYTTQFTRNIQTAGPLAQRQGISPTVLQITSGKVPEYAQALQRDIALNHPGTTVVVVAHSNTIDDILLALGGPDIGDLREDDYNRIFILSVGNSSEASLIEAAFPPA